MAQLPLRLRKMLQEEKYTDCAFLVDNTCVRAHRIVLAATSPVFEAMFYGPFANQPPADSPVTIVDVPLRVFRAMLDYVYTDTTDWSALSHYELLGLYYCVEKYLIRKEDVLEHIRSSLNCNNLFLYYDFAVRMGDQQLLGDCRQLLSELLDKKPNLFFKKVLQVNCDRVIRDYAEDGEEVISDEEPAVKRKPPLPIESIEDIVFGAPEADSLIAQYHQVGKECLNDILVLQYDDLNGIYSENLLLFILKWTKIQWKLDSNGQRKLPLQKIALINYFEGFVCPKRTCPLVENLISFLEDHFYLNNADTVSGWHLLQRCALKATRPLTIPPGESREFVTKFQVNHLISIKSFIINSRLNNSIVSRAMRSTNSHNIRQYREHVYLELCATGINERDPVVSIHKQRFNVDAEFNSECELFLNKCLHFHPDHVYQLRLQWPREVALVREYPQTIYERCQRMSLSDRQFSVIFTEDESPSNVSFVNKASELLYGGVLSGLQFLFVS